MTYTYFDTKLVMDVFCQMLGGINAAMLTTSTSETEHQRCESSLDIPAYVVVGKFIDAVEEGEYLSVILQKSDNRLVETCEFLVWFITARIVSASAVEDISSTIARFVFGDSLSI